jgi:hypothetical protein
MIRDDKMVNWLHHLFNPHCPECQHDKECKSCDVLQAQVDRLTRENERLLETLLDKQKPEPVAVQTDFKELKQRHIPWNVRRQMLENEDREKARILKEHSVTSEITTEELEKEMGIVAAARESGK